MPFFRWNSTFDALRQIAKIMEDKEKFGINKLNECCDFAGAKRFTNDDFDFIQEDVEVMAPLSISLDLLQGVKEMYLGYLLPVITTLLKSMENLQKKGLKYLDSVASAIANAVQAR